MIPEVNGPPIVNFQPFLAAKCSRQRMVLLNLLAAAEPTPSSKNSGPMVMGSDGKKPADISKAWCDKNKLGCADHNGEDFLLARVTNFPFSLTSVLSVDVGAIFSTSN